MIDAPTGSGAAALLAGRLTRGLRRRPDLAERLRNADITACLCAADGTGLTLLLDRSPPEVRLAAEVCTVRVEVTTEDLAALADGTVLLPLLLLSGRARHEGPVRALLRVAPILRTLAAEGAAGA